MARACLKIYINDNCVRCYGGNKSSIVKEVVRLKSLSTEDICKEYNIDTNSIESFRFSVIKVKRRNKVYRFVELQEDITEKEFLSILPNNKTMDILMKYYKYFNVRLDKEIKFTKDGKILKEFSYDNLDLLTGFVRADTVKEFGKKRIVESILKELI